MSASAPAAASLVIPIKLGRPIGRHLPEEVRPYISSKDWEDFCHALDELTLNHVDRNSTILMRFALMIAIACLVLVILFGYMDTDNDDDDIEKDDAQDNNNKDSTTTTLLVVLTAVPICFPFVMAALLNCHGAATMAKIVQLCRTHSQQWADRQPHVVQVRVQQLESVSDEDEVINKILMEFYIHTTAYPKEDLETAAAARVSSPRPPEASPQRAGESSSTSR